MRLTIFVPSFIVVSALLLSACASNDIADGSNPFRPGKSERELRLEAGKLYKLARQSLDSSDFVGALGRYDQLLIKYPYTEYATQAQLESIYAQYRNFESEGAATAADRFLKQHPRHARADYVHYLRGLASFAKGDQMFGGLPGTDPDQHDVSYARKAFDDFTQLIQKYPKSRYVADARQRMIYLRNRLAGHELAIVRYYVKRKALLAAAKRGERLLAEYPGAPQTVETLTLLEQAYRGLNLPAQADDARRLLDVAQNGPTPAAEPAPSPIPVPAVAAPEPLPAAPPAAEGIETRPLPQN